MFLPTLAGASHWASTSHFCTGLSWALWWQVKAPRNPPLTEGVFASHGKLTSHQLHCAMCSSLSHRTRLQWHSHVFGFFFLIAKSEQLRTTEIYSFIFLDSMGPESWRLWSHAASSYFREDSVPVFTSLRWLWELIGSWQRHSNFSLCRPAAPSLPLSVSPCLLLVLEYRLSHQDS